MIVEFYLAHNKVVKIKYAVHFINHLLTRHK